MMHLGHQPAHEIDGWTVDELLVNRAELISFLKEYKGVDGD